MSVLTLDSEVKLHPRVSIRPEPFGALLYHFGTRKLSFLKSRRLLAVVCSMVSVTTVRAALAEAGVSEEEEATYLGALSALRDSQMLVEAAP
jgi:putative mycofactocin binding protein MftB